MNNKQLNLLPLIMAGIMVLTNCKKNSTTGVNNEEVNQSEKSDSQTSAQSLKYNYSQIYYMGRIAYDNTAGCASLYFAGSSAEMNFHGTTVSARLSGNGDYIAMVDNNESTAKTIVMTSTPTTYVLFSGLANVDHNIKLFKKTATYTTLKFYSFELSSGWALNPPAAKAKRIEFYGDSQTEGDQVDIPLGDPDKTDGTGYKYFNNFYAYGAITARHFNAQYHCTAKSGIGLTSSYGDVVMPQFYNRANPASATDLWDFSKYQPGLMVVNLLQNDASIIPNTSSAQYKKWYTDKGITPTDAYVKGKYKEFLNTLRSKYPNASIICALGSMGAVSGTRWKNIISSAVSEVKAAGFTKIYVNFFPLKATPGHPRKQEQIDMANNLINFINTQGIVW